MIIAVTREVSSSIGRCELSHIERAPIDVGLARRQHTAYEECLESLGCRVLHLSGEPNLPDSVFVEDTAVVLDELAVITRPGAESRRPETESVAKILKPFRELYFIEPPATLDGGDVLRIGKNIYVGISGRSTLEAVAQLRNLVEGLGYTVTGVEIDGCLHLKSAVTLAGPDTILVNPEWVDPGKFGNMNVIEVGPSEPFAANALLVNGAVVYPDAFPETAGQLEAVGIKVCRVDVSELAKAEGGVTCCSLIFGE